MSGGDAGQSGNAPEEVFSNYKGGLMWKLIGENLGDQELFDRLMDTWATNMNISGLIAGFAYLVLSQAFEFTKEGWIGTEVREALYGIFQICAFGTALGAVLISVILYSNFRIAGPSRSLWFVSKAEFLCSLPITLIIISLLCLLIAAMLIVGGLYNDYVWTFTLVLYVGGAISLTWVWLYVDSRLKTATRKDLTNSNNQE